MHTHLLPLGVAGRGSGRGKQGGMCGYGISGGSLEKITTGNQKYTQLTP